MSGIAEGMRKLVIKSGEAEHDGVVVEVQDLGPGLDTAALERAFKAFYTTKPDGLGMGLSICQSIIEAHGGSLRATGNVPHGASFRFTVPREERWMILFGRSSPECSRGFRLGGAGCLADSGEWTRLCPNRVIRVISSAKA
jgi:hypothetical protein